ncbi:ABC transporter ATP-binding protein [Microtetraspora sp. NBRC 16547]|uniref:ABC transporter ATP-binding protein n=1 Tax=Microtetraspora sp. NBRC 16547 TaxID=3030993 RepID=UPI0025557986|nr:ABC transporter ATP-binding protein [Microtetraspora sp. NBRC 16547]
MTKRFRSGTIGIDNASLTIEGGEFVTFLGPSGSGKTTTLNTIAGFVRPTSGSIEIGGRDVTKVPPSKRNLGIVFQNYALFPHMSVRDNVAFGLHGRGLSKHEVSKRINDVLTMVRLGGLEDRRPKQLSGGQQQRVALARALVYQPPVLLMDEPLSALDKALRDQMQVEIGRIHREVGTTFLFVTHDQNEALGLSDRIVLFNEGRILQVGTPSELYEQPRSLFAAQFLGESNVFRGRVTSAQTLEFAGVPLRFNGGAPATKSAAIVVRPENLLVRQADEARPDENQVSALITNISYFGSFRSIMVSYLDGSSGQLRESASSEARFSRGDNVSVCWDPGRAVLVDDGEAAA